jgi:hypothetical protein
VVEIIEKQAEGPNDASETNAADVRARINDGNIAIGAGVGIGALGASSALIVGATCPLCFIIAPALVGAGIYLRTRSGGAQAQSEKKPDTDSES